MERNFHLQSDTGWRYVDASFLHDYVERQENHPRELCNHPLIKIFEILDDGQQVPKVDDVGTSVVTPPVRSSSSP